MERPRKRVRVAAPQGDNFDVESSRHVNDMRLKSSLECIFAKYSADFTDIGDVIDFETETIVEDNGHVACMRDERDTGPSQAQRFLRALSLGRDGGDEPLIHDNPSEDFDEQEDEANRKDNGEAVGRLSSRTKGIAPGCRAPPTLDAGQAEQGPFGAAMLQELSQNIASLIAPYLARFTGPSQAIEPAWRTPNIGAAIPKPVHGTPVKLPATRGSATSPKSESLWALPERRASAGHTQTTPGQLQYHGRILGEASDIDELSPDVSMTGHGTTQSSKYVRRERRSFPPFSHEEDDRLINMRGHHDSEQLVHWKDIYERFPDRPSWSLRYRYHKYLRKRVESSPVQPKTSSPLRSHTEQVGPEDSLPSPVSLESESGDRHTVTSHVETPRHSAHTSQHRERQPDMAVQERSPRILRSSTGAGKASAPVRDSVRDNKARMKEEKGASQGIHSMIPSSEPLHDGSGQQRQAEASRPSTRSGRNVKTAHSPRVFTSSANENENLNKRPNRAEGTVQAERTGFESNASVNICQVVIPARHNIDNNVAEHSPCVLNPHESISSRNDKTPSPRSQVPVALATRAGAGETPKSTPQRSTASNRAKTYSVTKKIPGTAKSGRRRSTQMVSNSDSEDELAL